MSDIESRFFVRSFIRFLQKEIEEGKFSGDSIESIEVWIESTLFISLISVTLPQDFV